MTVHCLHLDSHLLIIYMHCKSDVSGLLMFNNYNYCWYDQGHLSLSAIGNKCAKDNLGGGNFTKSLTNFSIQKSI